MTEYFQISNPCYEEIKKIFIDKNIILSHLRDCIDLQAELQSLNFDFDRWDCL